MIKAGRYCWNSGRKSFIETTAKDYEPVFTYADDIRLDLQKYDYRNH